MRTTSERKSGVSVGDIDAATVLAYLVILVAVPINWYAVWKIARLYRKAPHLGVLRDRLIVAVALAIIVTVFGIVFLNNELTNPVLSTNQTRLLTRTAVLGLTLPPLYWLWKYR